MVPPLDAKSIPPSSPQPPKPAAPGQPKPNLKVVPPPAKPVAKAEGKKDAFDGATQVGYAGQSLPSLPTQTAEGPTTDALPAGRLLPGQTKPPSKPEPRVQGPIPPADIPVSKTATALRAVGAGVGALSIGGGIALAVTAGGVALPIVGIAIAIVGLILMLICIISQQKALDGVAVTGKNSKVFRDFSHEVEFKPEYYDRPRNEDEIRDVLAAATKEGKRVKVIGSGHSFVGTFATTGHLVSLERMNWMQVVDRNNGLVAFGAGAKLKDVKEFLAKNGLAFQNLGGITEQAVIGAATTGTHGSGKTGIIATQVERLKIMTADGKTQWCSKVENPELFNAALVGLGGLGIVTEVVIKTKPAQNLRETITKTSFEDAIDQKKIMERLEKNDHFQMIWMPHSWKTLLVERNYTDDPAEKDWDENSDARPGGADFKTELGVFLTRARFLRPLAMRIAMGTLPDKESHVGRSDLILSRDPPPRQRETEWAFPVERTAEVMRELRKTIEAEGLLMNFPGAIRFVKGDNILMSPANRGGPHDGLSGDSVYFSTLLQGTGDADDRVMHVIQQTMKRLGGRPHWGKENDQYTAADAQKEYGERYETYRTMRDELDPNGIFRNAYLDKFFPPRPHQ